MTGSGHFGEPTRVDRAHDVVGEIDDAPLLAAVEISPNVGVGATAGQRDAGQRDNRQPVATTVKCSASSDATDGTAIVEGGEADADRMSEDLLVHGSVNSPPGSTFRLRSQAVVWTVSLVLHVAVACGFGFWASSEPAAWGTYGRPGPRAVAATYDEALGNSDEFSPGMDSPSWMPLVEITIPKAHAPTLEPSALSDETTRLAESQPPTSVSTPDAQFALAPASAGGLAQAETDLVASAMRAQDRAASTGSLDSAGTAASAATGSAPKRGATAQPDPLSAALQARIPGNSDRNAKGSRGRDGRSDDAPEGTTLVNAAIRIEGPSCLYPEEARSAGLEGTVKLRIVFDRDGKVTDVSVESSSGHAILDETAVQAAWQWRVIVLRRGIDTVIKPITFRL